MASSRIVVRVFSLGLSILGLACGSPSVGEDPTDAGLTDGGTVVAPGEVGLSVHGAKEQSSVGNVSAGGGKLFAVVQLTLTNGLSSAVTISPATFRLRTGDGLETVASPSAMQIPGACPSDAFLSAGRSISCVVGFEISRSAEPNALLYVGAADGQTEPGGIRAEAPVVSFERCTRCDDVCVDLMTNVMHCGGCGLIACDSCQDGVPLCAGGDFCIDEICIDPAVAAMLRTTTSPISCDALCSGQGKTCEELNPQDSPFLQRPLVTYRLADGQEVVVALECSQVPPAAYLEFPLKEVRCACR